VRDRREKSSQKQFISSQVFHRTPGGRVQKTTAGERFRPQILETFDPVAQYHTRDPPCNDSHTAQMKSNRFKAPKVETERGGQNRSQERHTET
jgi:hypothetical protein